MFVRVQFVFIERNENDNKNGNSHESEDDGEEQPVDDVGQFFPLLRPVTLQCFEALARVEQSSYGRRDSVPVGRRDGHRSEQLAVSNKLQNPNQSTDMSYLPYKLL